MKDLKIEDLIRMPHLQALLKNFSNINYEEAADYSLENLVKEYRILLKENRLHDLFECEWISAPPLSIAG